MRLSSLALFVGMLGSFEVSTAAAQVKPVRRPPTAPAPKPAPKPTAAPAIVPVPKLAEPMARVTGDVYDSLSFRVLPEATVQFVPVNDPARVRSVTTDSGGRYAVDSLAPGVYMVGVLHPIIDRLGLETMALAVRIAEPGDVVLPLALPSATTVIASRCKDAGTDLPPGAVIGVVRRASGAPLAGSGRVRVQYLETTIGPSGMSRRFLSRFGEVGESGQFLVCGVPTDAPLTTRAWVGSDSSGVLELRMDGGSPLLVRNLVVGNAQRTSLPGATPAERPRLVYRGSGSVRGIVRDAGGKPLPGARVALPTAGVEGMTTAAGQFTLDSLPGGSWMLEARAVGFQPQRVAVDILDSTTTDALVALVAVAPTVDTVRVRADRWSQQQAGFEQRKKMGFGYFYDEDAISRRNPRFAADLLRGTPGVTVSPGSQGRDRVLMRGTGGAGQCIPTIFLDGVRTTVPNGQLDDLVQPTDIRAVEVYTGTGSVPIEFQSNTGCGSLVIWTGARRK
jgi:hypothetical protein